MIRLKHIFCGCAAALIAGCQSTTAPQVSSAPAVRSIPVRPVPVISTESQTLAGYYARVQANLVSQGMMRTDGGGPDAPYNDEILARNFTRIAMFEEYAQVGGQLVAKETESKLHRWAEPVRMSLEFGLGVPEDQRAKDRRAVEQYAARMGRVTGHPVRMSQDDANFHVFIVDESSRRRMGPRLREIIPSISGTAVATVTGMPRSSYCLVFAWDPEDDGTYAKAVAVIRAEHPDLLRLSCIHEEIAQGMGLSNDSPLARPSVFNDDEEFGLLTRHDEKLLKMLYDRRLQPGMSVSQAEPIVRQIAQELTGDAS